MAELRAKYQQYEEYKNSGIEWLGKIPKNWISTQVKYGFTVVLGKMLQTTPKSNADLLKPYLKAQNIQPFGVDPTNVGSMWFSADERKRLLLKKRDVLVSEGGDVGRAAIWNDEIDECYIQNAINRVRPRYSNDSRFFYYWINYLKATDFINIICNKATIAHYTADKLQGSPLILPSVLEQVQIANFLDFETAQIDTLIEKQQTLIQLLKEKRQAVISHAVTKGLNPDVPMKDSGVEWLGDVPEHWDVVKLSYRYEVLLGKMLDDKKVTGNYLGGYIRNTDVQWNGINTEDLPQMDFRPEEQERYSVKKGDLIVCEGGDIGRSAIWKEDKNCFYQKALHRLRPHNPARDSTKFMLYVMFDAVHQERFSGGIAKATIAHLPAEKFRQYKFAYPHHAEQLEISNYLDGMCDKFEAIELSAQRQVELLKERRIALISAAVTGKIDVRGWQAPE